MKLVLVIVGILVLLVGLVVGGAVWMRSHVVAGAGDVAVRFEPASEGALVELVSVPGEIQPETKVQISARVSAQILALPHKEGETVTKWIAPTEAQGAATTQPVEPPESSVLVRLDARDLESALRSAEARARAQEAEIGVARNRVDAQRATIAAAQATLSDAERELARQEALFATRDVAEQAVEQARTKVTELKNQFAASRHNLTADEGNLVVLKHNFDASQADIAKAREQLNYTVITSKIDGTVIKVNSKIGENVVPGIQGSLGSVILEVADLSRMMMFARVDEASVARLKPGQRAQVRMQAYRDEIFEGTVESVAMARADSQSASGRSANSMESGTWYEARILLKTEPGRRIFIGLNADADIEAKRHEGIRIPSQAVLPRPVDGLPEDLKKLTGVDKTKQSTSVVYRAINGKAVVTPVKVGPSDETHTLILEGLKAGDPVITGPYKILDALQHDQKINATAATPTTRPAVSQPTTKPG